MAILRADREAVLTSLAASVYPYVDEHRRHSPLPLASVCRLWRAVALSTCRLWTHFAPYDRDGDNDTRPHLTDLLMCWLSRAGRLKLHICIELPSSPLWIWWRMDGFRSPPISDLTTIALEYSSDATIPALLDAPRLREVILDRFRFGDDWRTSVPWIQLTSLNPKSQNVLECLEVLSHTPNLEVLTFWTCGGAVGIIFPPPSLPRLHTLHLGANGSSGLLPYLTLPALDELRLGSITSGAVEALTALITRSGCSPTTLFVTFYNSRCMYDLISRMPSVRMLRMTCPAIPSAHFTELFHSMSKHPSSCILPALTSFIIDECCVEIPLRPLVNMLMARRVKMEGVAQLNSFKLLFHQDFHNPFPKVNLNWQTEDVGLAVWELRDLRSRGLQLDIQSTIKWLSGNITRKMIEEIGSAERS
ncbi:hypothetical protein B0H16DRAFT_1877184 [Mycena metata]|uniref:F-box domain-containing protein n=1 Tax=Mycena metata TaxID=1033252 RepID=A0AAD7KGA4_9AGAR|nr:hypothetical protein B0H16DRAFT_1877184 [Mycena metata]